MYSLYTVIGALALLAASPYFAYRAARHGKYVRSLRQRFGRLPVAIDAERGASIWIQAVSVGEVLTTRALVAGLRSRYPGFKLFVSTTTDTGEQVARSRLPGVDGVFYFPFDVPPVIARVLGRIRPRLFIMMETEIWPNLLRACRRHDVVTVLVNGRISARSYPRYRLVRPFIRRVLGDIDRLCAQTEESARRLVDLGADPARVTVTGSLKFDSLDWTGLGPHRGPDRVLRYFRVAPERPVVIAASTLRGEEKAVLRAFARLLDLYPRPLLILAPRHPERFAEVEQLCRDEGFDVVRRSELLVDREPKAEIVLLDTVGELARVYQVATVVFVGGSLVDAGGHNILEPAVFGKPILFGPHMQNFAEIAEAFVANEAAVRVVSPLRLETELIALLGDPVRQARLGAAARALVEANRGAADRTLDAIARVLPPETASPYGHLRLVP